MPIMAAVLDTVAGKDEVPDDPRTKVELAGQLEGRAALAAYWQRLQDRPGFQAATARTGPMTPPL